jgi:2-methylcitrate dehydratase PrpD
MDETKALAEFARKLKYEDLPKEVINKTKQLILDQLGCQVAGSTLPWTKGAYEFAVDYRNAREESTIINYGLRTSAQDVAFVNASFGHGFLGDDADSVCFAHFGSIIIPAALAMAEKERVDGKEFIRAVVLGYEVASRIGAAGLGAMIRGFHPGPVFGPFGVAVAAGTILGFSEDRLLQALAIAGSHSSGLMEYSLSGGTVNRLHSGIAAQNGIRAALLAEKGFTGPATVLEGGRGVLHAFADTLCLDEITRGLGESFRVLLIELKTHCCCGSSSAVFDAVSEIKREHGIRYQNIEKIVVDVSPATFKLTGSILEPRDITSAQFSARFGTGLALVKGGNGLKEYTEENLRNPDVLALAKETELIVDDESWKQPGKNNPAKVTIRQKNGAVHSQTVCAARGSILNPMTEEEVRQKFREFASDVLPSSHTDAVIETVTGLDSIGDIKELVRLLVVNGTGGNVTVQ